MIIERKIQKKASIGGVYWAKVLMMELKLSKIAVAIRDKMDVNMEA
jgi:hypothetical protein